VREVLKEVKDRKVSYFVLVEAFFFPFRSCGSSIHMLFFLPEILCADILHKLVFTEQAELADHIPRALKALDRLAYFALSETRDQVFGEPLWALPISGLSANNRDRLMTGECVPATHPGRGFHFECRGRGLRPVGRPVRAMRRRFLPWWSRGL
jgi:hypothetical protein